MKAARGFDPTKSDNFLGYAVPTILGEVKRFFRDNAWAVRPPRRIQELQAEISAAVSTADADTGRRADAGGYRGRSRHRVKEVVEALSADGCFAPTSLDRPPARRRARPLAEALGAEDPGYAHAEAVVALRPLCENLTERERRIVYLRFFHEWTQARIAEEFGVTQMQVSRLLTRIFTKLREQLGSLDAIDIGLRSVVPAPVRWTQRPLRSPDPRTATSACTPRLTSHALSRADHVGELPGLDDLGGDRAQLDVVLLRVATKHGEGLVGGEVEPLHQDPRAWPMRCRASIAWRRPASRRAVARATDAC